MTFHKLHVDHNESIINEYDSMTTSGDFLKHALATFPFINKRAVIQLLQPVACFLSQQCVSFLLTCLPWQDARALIVGINWLTW